MSCEAFINYKAKWKILSICEEYMTRKKIGKIVNDQRREKRVSEKNWTNIPNY